MTNQENTVRQLPVVEKDGLYMHPEIVRCIIEKCSPEGQSSNLLRGYFGTGLGLAPEANAAEVAA